ncbi:MAG: hypothetical protein WAZ48_07820, partial [Lysobacteraceae bacterium]
MNRNNHRRYRSFKRLVGLLIAGVSCHGVAYAQSVACAPNEVVQDLSADDNPWTAGSLVYSANIGTGASALSIVANSTSNNWASGYPTVQATGAIGTTFSFLADHPDVTASNTMTFTFSKPINKLRLTATDLDHFGGTDHYADRVTVSGLAPTGGTVTPTVTAASAMVTVSGNAAFASAAATDECTFDQSDCNATYDFSAPITTLTVIYSNQAPPAQNDPTPQLIGLKFGGFCVQNPNAALTKTAPASASVGTAFNFGLAVSNPGSAATTSPPGALQVTDVINANLLTINGITPASGWTCTPNSGFPINAGNVTVTCAANGDVNAGVVNQSVATINVTAKAGALPGPVANTANITAGSGGDIDSADNSSSTSTSLALIADLVLTKTNTPGVNGNVDQTADTVVSGATAVYTITVSNAGPDTVANAVVTDPVPTNLTCATASCTASGGAACPV